MLDGKFAFLLIVVLILIIVVSMFLQQKKELYNSCIQPTHGNQDFYSRPNFKAAIPPRFYSGDYRSEIQGSIPPMDVLAAPVNPMDYAKMVGVTTDVPNDMKYMTPEQIEQNIHDTHTDPLEYVDNSDILPGDMYNYNSNMGPSNPDTYVYDRIIFANQKRRTREGVDYIRGDLPIVPEKRGWHDVSVKPHLDLYKGAFSQIFDTDTCIEREDIMVNSSRSEFDRKFNNYTRI